MPDPFEQMKQPLVPVDPDPIFAARLRNRIASALDDPKGTTMPDIELHDRVSGPETTATISPYLAVAGAEAALEWYVEALGARLVGTPIVMPDGTIGHAELDFAGARLMLAEGRPGSSVEPPDPGRGASVTIHLSVTDVDGTIERAVSGGADLERPAADYPYGRNGVVRDPFGHRWLVSGPEPAMGPRHGDVGYVSLWVPDVDRAAAFFSALLGWRYGPASGPQGRQVEGQSLHHGLWGVEEHNTLFCCFAVDDVDEAATRVRDAGGTAAEPHLEPYGRISECTDDQGVAFAVFEPPGGVATGEPTASNGILPGDLAYVTMEVNDSARTRAFYGSVLGWTFTPGRVDDGWGVEGVSPMFGISGGHEVTTTVPMYRVDDIDTAVRALRDIGGTCAEPEHHPYGITATCTDDQGTRFYLGQL
jgi:predicted enzyme related to lactoylglutathione lyase